MILSKFTVDTADILRMGDPMTIGREILYRARMAMNGKTVYFRDCGCDQEMFGRGSKDIGEQIDKQDLLRERNRINQRNHRLYNGVKR